MQQERPTHGLPILRVRLAGFSLVEVMIVLIVICAMVAMSSPSFKRSIEQSRADIAAANLRAIWSAERVYWLDKHQYATATDLTTAKLLDPEILKALTSGTAMGGYIYTLTLASDLNTFTAQAERSVGSSVFSIDQDGTISVSGTYTPGFQ
jgi:prepilin-type N-terminal cleavage/methylation domain-containing protein